MVQSIIPLMPQKARIALYVAYAVAGAVLGAVQVGVAAAEIGQPTWLTVALAVYAFLGTAFGYTATTQTGKEVEFVQGPPGPPGPTGRDGQDFTNSSARAEIERLLAQNRDSED